MNDLKIKAVNISLILLITGIGIKLFSEKSEKSIIKMIVTIIVIISLFNINIHSLLSQENEYSWFGFEEDLSQEENELKDDISKLVRDEIEEDIKNIVGGFDSSADTEIIIEESIIKINVTSEKLNSSDETEIISELKDDFDCELELHIN